MEVFTQIDNAQAIIRQSKGVQKQVAMYRRGDRVFVPFAGGYIQVLSKESGGYVTMHPDVKVLEFEAEGVDLSGTGMGRNQLRYKAPK